MKRLKHGMCLNVNTLCFLSDNTQRGKTAL
nr:MAG TPA: hypothetical protein [Caudoviricetes sp.]